MSKINKICPVDDPNEQREYRDNLDFNMNHLEDSSHNLLLHTPIQNLRNNEEINFNRVSKYMIPVDEEEEEPEINNGQRLSKPPDIY